jgi:uncharacterized protein YkwD
MSRGRERALLRPRLMHASPDCPSRHRRLLGLGLGLGLASLGLRAARQPALAQVLPGLVDRANAFRRSQGLAAVAPNRALTQAAGEFAAYMARTGRYSHEADGRQPAQRAEAQGYAWCLVAENIAFVMSSAGFATDELAERLMQGWINSPGHRRNLLEAEATETGVGIAHSTDSDRYYAVQMFGRPTSLQVRFELVNRGGAAVSYQLGDKTFTLAPGVTRSHTQCSRPTLRLTLPGEAAPVPLQAADGGRYRIEPAGRRWHVVAE